MKRCLAALLIMVGVAGTHTPAARAEEYHLEQVISPIICTSTTVNTGTVIAVDNSCNESYLPTITEIIVDTSRLVIRGKFDSAKSQLFRVKVFGVWYVLGQSPLFTYVGNDWQLDLSSLRENLDEGRTDIELEFTANNNLFYETTIRKKLYVPPLSEVQDTDTPKPTGLAFLADTGQAMIIPVLVGAGAVVLAVFVWRLSRRKRRS